MEKDETSTTYLNAIKTFLPVKIYGLMKAGRPLHCNSSSWSRIFQRGRTGISVEKKRKEKRTTSRARVTDWGKTCQRVLFFFSLFFAQWTALRCWPVITCPWHELQTLSAQLDYTLLSWLHRDQFWVSGLQSKERKKKKKRNKRIECVCFWLLWQSGCSPC